MPTLTDIGNSGDDWTTSAGKEDDVASNPNTQDESKTPALGLLNMFPSNRKRKETRRVTTSPAKAGALSLLEPSPSVKKGTPLSPKKGKASPDRSLESSEDSEGKAKGDSGRKRKATEYSDTENEGDGSNERKAPIARKKQQHIVGASLFDDECEDASGSNGDNSSDDDGMEDSLVKGSIARAKAKSTSFSEEDESSGDESDIAQSSSRKPSMDLQSSSEEESSTEGATAKRCYGKPRKRGVDTDSDEEIDEEDAKRSRSVSGQGWLTSHNASNAGGDSSSESSDEEEEDEIDARLANLYRGFNWLDSPSKAAKMEHLVTTANSHDKALQLLLWDIGFDYNIYLHQFEAIRFVAGFIPSFPCKALADDEPDEDEDVQVMLQLDEYGRLARARALTNEDLVLPGKGMLLGDEMGLGKTIEALAGAVLRNSKKRNKGKKKKPTLIITPQDGVQQQWVESLVKAGVEPARIRIIGEQRQDTKKRGGTIDKKNTVRSGEFIVCTRYKILTEVRNMFTYATTSKTAQRGKKKSLLFPSVPVPLVKKLRHEYNVDKGKERRSGPKIKGEDIPDRITKLMKDRKLSKTFETVVIDECHFLRNVFAYWGIGAAILGARAERTVLLSGTPYNNGPRDMSALMCFIDPTHDAALVKWWRKATQKGNRDDVIDAVSGWREKFMLRRTKDILQDKLPALERRFVDVPVRPSELGIYEAYEAAFIHLLNQLQEDMDDKQTQKEMVEAMMACMACMRMSLIHPMLPGGREATIQFSPSRKHLLSCQENKHRCVFCGDNYPSQKAEEYKKKMEIKMKEENDENLFDQLLGLGGGARSEDNIMDDDDDEPRRRKKDTHVDKEKGPIVELEDVDFCRAAGSNCRHFAHERCIEVNEAPECPRCRDLSSRIHIASASGTTDKRVYCQNIMPTVSDSLTGFTTSSKLDKAIDWLKAIPHNEKAIMLSFFKGSLDLIEAILKYELGVESCRYDGDVSKKERALALNRFKTSKKHRVLLASVQSGGTGLNITAANHVCFIDRWFNPQIHDQAESRCHRLGQKKDVKVAYLDTSYTVDIVMKHVNTHKESNAEVLLADGTSLRSFSGVGYKEVRGMIGHLFQAIIAARHSTIAANHAGGNEDALLLSSDDADFESKLLEATERASQKKAVKKEDTAEDESHSSSDDDSDSDLVDRDAMFGSESQLKESKPSSKSNNDDDDDDDSVSSMLNEPVFGNKSQTKCSRLSPGRNDSAPSSSDESDIDILDETIPFKSHTNVVKPAASSGASTKEEKSMGNVLAEGKETAENPPKMEAKADPGRPFRSAAADGNDSEVVSLLSDEEDDTFEAELAKAIELSLQNGGRKKTRATGIAPSNGVVSSSVQFSNGGTGAGGLSTYSSTSLPSRSTDPMDELERELDDAFEKDDFERAKRTRERMKRLRG